MCVFHACVCAGAEVTGRLGVSSSTLFLVAEESLTEMEPSFWLDWSVSMLSGPVYLDSQCCDYRHGQLCQAFSFMWVLGTQTHVLMLAQRAL